MSSLDGDQGPPRATFGAELPLILGSTAFCRSSSLDLQEAGGSEIPWALSTTTLQAWVGYWLSSGLQQIPRCSCLTHNCSAQGGQKAIRLELGRKVQGPDSVPLFPRQISSWSLQSYILAPAPSLVSSLSTFHSFHSGLLTYSLQGICCLRYYRNAVILLLRFAHVQAPPTNYSQCHVPPISTPILLYALHMRMFMLCYHQPIILQPWTSHGVQPMNERTSSLIP